MPETRFDAVAIGHAIVDIIAHCDEAFLDAQGVTKGRMRLVDAETAAGLVAAMGPKRQVSGGSAANTMVGLAALGGRAAFIGKVADDDFGRTFAEDVRAAGVVFETPSTRGGAPTGQSLILVAPDGERTMNTSLGVGPELGEDEINAAFVGAASYLYLEGYLFDQPRAKAAFYRAADIARKAERRVALTLSDSFCVDRHRAEFVELIRTRVDLLFANEDEIKSLYETPSFETARDRVRRDVEIAVLTRSALGSVIVRGDETVLVSAEPVAQIIDATGAGDMLAAGVLFGLAKGYGLERAGRLGSLAAAEIISHVGARPQVDLAELARRRGLI